jgi:hypothetical protein
VYFPNGRRLFRHARIVEESDATTFLCVLYLENDIRKTFYRESWNAHCAVFSFLGIAALSTLTNLFNANLAFAATLVKILFNGVLV